MYKLKFITSHHITDYNFNNWVNIPIYLNVHTFKTNSISFDLNKAHNMKKNDLPYNLKRVLDYLKGFKEIKIRMIQFIKLGSKTQKFYSYYFIKDCLQIIPIN